MKDFSNRTVYVVEAQAASAWPPGELARRGAHIVIFGRDTQRLSHAWTESHPADISGSAIFIYLHGCLRLAGGASGVEKTAASAGPPDVLINWPAGVPGRFEDIGMTAERREDQSPGLHHTAGRPSRS
jgi:NAD(P)-dependent dehydrogenase (short-subunit alcohol dehydrogenase family)